MKTERVVQRKVWRLREEHSVAERQVAEAKRQRSLLKDKLSNAEYMLYQIRFNGITCDADECSTRMLRFEAIEIDNEFFCEDHDSGAIPPQPTVD
jgi:hypothetical protein